MTRWRWFNSYWGFDRKCGLIYIMGKNDSFIIYIHHHFIIRVVSFLLVFIMAAVLWSESVYCLFGNCDWLICYFHLLGVLVISLLLSLINMSVKHYECPLVLIGNRWEVSCYSPAKNGFWLSGRGRRGPALLRITWWFSTKMLFSRST